MPAVHPPITAAEFAQRAQVAVIGLNNLRGHTTRELWVMASGAIYTGHNGVIPKTAVLAGVFSRKAHKQEAMASLLQAHAEAVAARTA